MRTHELGSGTVFDPNGVDVGSEDPFPPLGEEEGVCVNYDPNYVPSGPEPPLLNPMEDSATCIVDGIEGLCPSSVSEATVKCPDNQCRRFNPNGRNRNGAYEDFHATSDGRIGYLPSDAIYIRNGIYRSPSSGTPYDELSGLITLEFNHASTLPQNPSNSQITPCDRKFASIFGDSNAIGRTAYDYNGRYRGLDPTARANAAGLPRSDFSNPVWDSEHLYNFPHLSGNLAGTENADIYVPGNYTGRPTGPTKGDAIATFHYKNFFGMKNVTLAVFHVGNFGTERMADGSVRIGTTGGPGGNTPGSSTPNLHSHFELWRGRGYRPPGAGRDAARIPLTQVICK